MNLQEIIAEVLEHVRGMWRFRWAAVVMAWVVAIGSWYYVYSMPDIYQASAQVSVDTNRLLAQLTQGLTANENLLNEVDLVSRALLTRPNLENVVRETDLDLRAATSRQQEELITGLQKRIEVQGGKNKVFTISFSDHDRQKAQEVVAAVLNTFIEEALGAQGDDASMTENALKAELLDHEQRLQKAESDLAQFKKENLGYMPNDGGDYYDRLQAALSSVRQSEQELRLLDQRRLELERQIQGEEPVFGIMTGGPGQNLAGCSQGSQITDLENQLSQLRVGFTEKHPRIMTLNETIAVLSEQCNAEVLAAREAGYTSRPTESDPLDANPVYQNLRMQLSNTEVEIAALRSEHQNRQLEVQRLRTDVDKIAAVETELKRLNRDYGVVQGRFQEMLKRWETLQSKKRLDPVTDGVQFTILEPPFVPAVPSGPNRRALLLASMVVAFGVGLAIAFALNMLKPVFYTRRSISRIAGIPVLGTVSLILSPEEKARSLRHTLAWAMCNVMLIGTALLLVGFESQASLLFRNLVKGMGI